jgi:hypothetical protein
METAPSSRYVLPKDLDTAIKHLDDQQLDRLVSVALEERARRKIPPPDKSQRQRNAVAREFGISRSDVQRTLAGDAKK